MASNLDNLLHILKIQIEKVIEHYREIEEQSDEEVAIQRMSEGVAATKAKADIETVLFGSPAVDTHVMQWAFPIAAVLLDLEDGNELLVKGEDGRWLLADKQ